MILYKYFPPERLDVLDTATIRFTQPAVFNDVFESRPRDFLIEDLHWRSRCEHPECVKAHVRSIQSHLTLRERSSCGILCLTALQDNLLMWAHYAAEHTGFVIGFDTTHAFFSRSPESTGLCKVTYSDTRGTRPLSEVERELARQPDAHEYGLIDFAIEFADSFQSSVAEDDYRLTKATAWAYEHEWRIIRSLKDGTRVLNEQAPLPVYLFAFPRSAVHCVILGCRAFATLYPSVRGILERHPAYRSVAVLQAEPSERGFALTCTPFPLPQSALALDLLTIQQLQEEGVLVPIDEAEYCGALEASASDNRLISTMDAPGALAEEMVQRVGATLAMGEADWFTQQGSWSAAKESFQRAIRAREAALAHTPEAADAHYALAVDRTTYAGAALAAGDSKEALLVLRRAQESFRVVDSLHHDNHVLTAVWARALVSLAQMEYADGTTDAGNEALLEAVRLLDRISSPPCTDVALLTEVSRLNLAAGMLLASRDGTAAAGVRCARQAADLLAAGTRMISSDGALLMEQAEATQALAVLLDDTADPAGARVAWSRARRLYGRQRRTEPGDVRAAMGELQSLVRLIHHLTGRPRHAGTAVSIAKAKVSRLPAVMDADMSLRLIVCCSDLSRLSADMGHAEEAIWFLTFAVESCPHLATHAGFVDDAALLPGDGFLALGELQRSGGGASEMRASFEEAVCCFESIQSDQHPDVWMRRGRAHRLLAECLMLDGATGAATEQLSRAAEAYERCQQLAPHEPYVRNGKGITLLRLGELQSTANHPEAVRLWQAACSEFECELEHHPSCSDAFQNLGNAWLLLGLTHRTGDPYDRERCLRHALAAYGKDSREGPGSAATVLGQARATTFLFRLLLSERRFEDLAELAGDVVIACDRMLRDRVPFTEAALVTGHAKALTILAIHGRSDGRSVEQLCLRALGVLEVGATLFPGADFAHQRQMVGRVMSTLTSADASATENED